MTKLPKLKLTALLAFLLVQFSFAQTNQFDTKNYKQLVKDWNNAHDTWQFKDLRKLYAPKVLFYCSWVTKDQCILDKTSQMRPSKLFRQSISGPIKIQALGENLTICSFIKSVREDKTLKDYAAYLVIKEIDGQLRIIAESDEITDRKRNFVLSASVFKANENKKKPANNKSDSEDSNLLLYSASSVALIAIIAFAARRRRRQSQEIPVAKTVEETKAAIPEEVISNETALSNKEKGDLFESFIINMFDKNYFTLLDRTCDTVTNGIHAVSRSNPDFLYQFELREYVKKFAVECTYRSNTSELIEIKTFDQLSRYKKYGEDQKVDVYILLGLERAPQNPKELFVIPLTAARPKMTYNELKRFGRSTVNRLFFNPDKGILT